MAVEPTQIRGRLLGVERLKPHEAVDIPYVLNGITVVGAYWNEMDIPSGKDILAIEAFVEHLADSRALFDRAELTSRPDGVMRPAPFETSGSSGRPTSAGKCGG